MTAHDLQQASDMARGGLKKSATQRFDDHESKPYNPNEGQESDESDWGLEDPSTAESFTKKKSTILKADMDRMSIKTDDLNAKRKSGVHLGEGPQSGGCFSCFSFKKSK